MLWLVSASRARVGYEAAVTGSRSAAGRSTSFSASCSAAESTWTRPTEYKLAGARSALKDATIERRFKRYGDWAGLAFWLYLTRSWVDEGLPV
jgi:hypothetical protein